MMRGKTRIKVADVPQSTFNAELMRLNLSKPTVIQAQRISTLPLVENIATVTVSLIWS